MRYANRTWKEGPEAGRDPLTRIARLLKYRIADPAIDEEDTIQEALLKLARSPTYQTADGRVDWARIERDVQSPAVATRLTHQILVDVHRKVTAQCRGSGRPVESLNAPAPGSSEGDGLLEEAVTERKGRPVEEEALGRILHTALAARLDRALANNLAAREREVFNARFFRDCTPIEIAEELGLTVDNVNTSLSRARSRLRRLLLEAQPANPGD